MPDEVAWTEGVRSELLRAVAACRPRELVAVLGGRCAGRAASVTAFVEVPNVAPADDSFAVEPAAFAAAERSLRRAGCAFVGFVHSHPNGSAAPSERDRAELWPCCLQLIAAGGDLRAYWLDEARVLHPLPGRVAEAV
ncbi:MAG: Mov34/MPN/PAD-1 family protein [Planctomycetota bacterium]